MSNTLKIQSMRYFLFFKIMRLLTMYRVLQHQPSRTDPSSHQEDIILLNLLDQRSLKPRLNQFRTTATTVESRDIFLLTILNRESRLVMYHYAQIAESLATSIMIALSRRSRDPNISM
ncbi:hypothetical protein O6H91_05G096200 [Diphasiastrum complanatum]|uniref:Uncharacterized protein n=1 Tax=Diphasiastrum complanatum TaxID=34168 RepID=A0ACC2DRY4_DIPCM|nr:hypothetical protein O6H91_05G096200 [Diphasiastrum complanatum]